MAKLKAKLKKVKAHLKDDMKMFEKEKAEDRKLLRAIKDKKKMPDKGKMRHEKGESRKEEKREHRKEKSPAGKFKVVMKEFKEGKLHSDSKEGPLVTKPSQAYAIAYAEKRRRAKKRRR